MRKIPLVLGRAAGQTDEHAYERTARYWNTEAQYTLQDRLVRKINTRRAKNIIMFLGDGMSVATLAAARTYKGQLSGRRGEEDSLSFEKFPYSGLSKVRFSYAMLYHFETHIFFYLLLQIGANIRKIARSLFLILKSNLFVGFVLHKLLLIYNF